MMVKQAKRRRPNGQDLVKAMLAQLPMMAGQAEPITQERVAQAIGCHRHWFRRHDGRYDLATGEPDAQGLTPLQILEAFEDERTREKKLSPLEIALQNAEAVAKRQQQQIDALEQQLEAQRRLLHLIAINRVRLGINEKELFKPL